MWMELRFPFPIIKVLVYNNKKEEISFYVLET